MPNTHETELSQAEYQRRSEIVAETRALLINMFPIENQTDSTLGFVYAGFYLQIDFSALHPLLMLQFICACSRPVLKRDCSFVNRLNLKCVLGTHYLDHELGCYVFRVTQWLDATPTRERIIELIGRGCEEAARGYNTLFCG